MDAPPRSAIDARRRAVRLVGPLLAVLLLIALATRTGTGAPSAIVDLLLALATAVPVAAAWLVAAMGFGRLLRGRVIPDGPDAPWLQLGLGVGLLLTLDATLGRLGLLFVAGGTGSWVLLAAGLALAADQLRRRIAPGAPTLAPPPMPWLAWTAVPALAVLVTAACSAPGWLWSTEFGGYDALSYHLQLPKEWLALGHIDVLPHNVYSALPGYVEAAYAHLAALHGSAVAAATSAQLLHAMLAVAAAAMIGRVAHRLAGHVAGVVAFVLALGTPWTIVTGSLAYNEMAVVLLLATGVLALIDEDSSALRRGAMIGLVTAAACGAKLTAAGFAAVPLLTLLLWMTPRRRWVPALGVTAVAGLLAGLPYLLGNLLATGNPLFPFAAGVLGQGHWTTEQAATWATAHGPRLPAGDRLAAVWHQLLRFGVGPNPDPGEPWQPQWSLLPWLALLGALLAPADRAARAWSRRLSVVLVVQLAFWLGFTHLQSRFLLPGLVPMAVLAGLGTAVACRAIDGWAGRSAARILPWLGAALLVLYAGQSVLIYLGERNGAPAAFIGRAGVFTGAALDEAQRRDLGSTLVPAIAVNHLLPHGSRVLLVGEATPLYYDLERITWQTTWDRGPLSGVLRAHGDDPPAWIASLRDEGFTHVLVNLEMLHRWERSGWNDPALEANRLTAALDTHATAMLTYIRAAPAGRHPQRWAVLYAL